MSESYDEGYDTGYGDGCRDTDSECEYRHAVETEKLEEKIESLQSELKEARAVIEFYGDTDTWHGGNHPDCDDATSGIPGKKARAYLAKYSEGDE